MESYANLCLYIGYFRRDFPETLYLALFTHALQATLVWLRSVTN